MKMHGINVSTSILFYEKKGKSMCLPPAGRAVNKARTQCTVSCSINLFFSGSCSINYMLKFDFNLLTSFGGLAKNRALKVNARWPLWLVDVLNREHVISNRSLYYFFIGCLYVIGKTTLIAYSLRASTMLLLCRRLEQKNIKNLRKSKCPLLQC